MTRVVRFPRLLATLAPEIARELDDLLRAILVGWLLFVEFATIATFMWAQNTFLNMSITYLHQELPVFPSILMMFNYLCGLAMLFAGIFISTRRGRLGGHISRQRQQENVEIA